MELTPKNNNRLFWTVQVVGWMMVNSLTFLLSSVFSAKYVLFSYVMHNILGIAVTGIYRMYLKKYVTIDWYGKNTMISLFLIMSMCILAFIGVEYGIEYLYGMFFTRTSEELGFMEKSMGIRKCTS